MYDCVYLNLKCKKNMVESVLLHLTSLFFLMEEKKLNVQLLNSDVICCIKKVMSITPNDRRGNKVCKC